MVPAFVNQKCHYDTFMGSILHKKILTLKPQKAFKANKIKEECTLSTAFKKFVKWN